MPPVLILSVPLVVSLLAWRAGALTLDGAVAALGVGVAVLVGTGWPGAAVLAAFFVPSTLVGRLAASRGRLDDVTRERRNARQVLANGGAGAAGALLEMVRPGLGFWVLTSSLAAAAADTWATSVGAWSRTDPRHVLTGRPVPRGTSGGVSLTGTFGAVGGSLLVAGIAALVGESLRVLVAGISIGFGGMLLDSLLGAVLQGRFECSDCRAATENEVHCGTPAGLVRGLRWVDNDVVNFFASAVAALAGAGAWRALAF